LLVLFLMIFWGRRVWVEPEVESRFVICKSCRLREERVFDPEKIADIKCTKCGGAVGFAWKCNGCDFEFPMVLKKIAPGSMTREQIRRQRLLEWRCPNCGGEDCGPLVILK
jgi:translation initiation factor 2 beta subunit (eIF-2beta)/eIF-5